MRSLSLIAAVLLVASSLTAAEPAIRKVLIDAKKGINLARWNLSGKGEGRKSRWNTVISTEVTSSSETWISKGSTPARYVKRSV